MNPTGAGGLFHLAAEIDVGYAKAAHLSREFKKVHGVSPAEAAYGRPKRTYR